LTAGSTLSYVKAMEKVDCSDAVTLSGARVEANSQLEESILASI